LGTLLVSLLIVIGSGVAVWYGLRNFAETADPLVLWTYQNVIRPKVLEQLPPNLPAQEKQEVLDLMDSGVQKYLALTAEEKKSILKEGLIAAYYFSQHQIVPPEKIPHLSAFIKEHIKKPLPAKNPPKGVSF
jgi:hypothetical protein